MGTTYSYYLGAEGWEHPAWEGTFYPDDLPAEWRLSYYNVRFPCVFLPSGLWLAAPVGQIRAWVDDCLERFRFVVELPGRPLSKAEEARLDLFGGRLAMCISPGVETEALLCFDTKTDLRKLAASLGGRQGPLFLISRDADLATIEQVETLLELI